MAEEEERRGKPFGDDHPPPRRGRPKGARGRKTIVTQIANETHKVSIEGKPMRVRTVELVLRALEELASQGDLRAQKSCDRLEDKYGHKEQEGGLLVVPEQMPMHLYAKAVELHNRKVVQPDPPEDLN